MDDPRYKIIIAPLPTEGATWDNDPDADNYVWLAFDNQYFRVGFDLDSPEAGEFIARMLRVALTRTFGEPNEKVDQKV